MSSTGITKKQIEEFKKIREKWIKIGVDVNQDDFDEEVIKSLINDVYKMGGELSPPKIYVFVRSPREVVKAYNTISKMVERAENLSRNFNKPSYFPSVKTIKRTPTEKLILDQLESQVKNVLINDEKHPAALTNWKKTWKYISSVSEDNEKIDNTSIEVCFGQGDANWLSFYDCFLEVVKLESVKKMSPLIEVSKRIGWWMPMVDFCIVSRKPLELHYNEKGLHHDGGPAVRFADGYEIYALNGIIVPKTIAETPRHKLNPKLALSEKNAEIRREIVRKIGINEMVAKLNAKVIDREKDESGNTVYELLKLKFNDEDRVYLKMLNPSLGIWHVEGVPPTVSTINDAIKFRNGTKDRPIYLT